MITGDQAKEIARKFLEQHHSIYKIEEPVLKDGVWLVGILVSSPHTRKFLVEVNSRTGHIVGF